MFPSWNQIVRLAFSAPGGLLPREAAGVCFHGAAAACCIGSRLVEIFCTVLLISHKTIGK